MHILFFADHHPDSLGGVQTSLMLQKKFLERAGHTVTMVVSRRFRRNRRLEGMIEVPSLPLPPTGAYSIEPSLKLAYRTVQRKLAKMALPVDIVHVQADVWGAILGAAWAKDHNLPCVHTVHTNLDLGFAHTLGPVPAGWLRYSIVGRLRCSNTKFLRTARMSGLLKNRFAATRTT